MPRDTLRFVHSAHPPAADLRVFDSLSREFLGTEFTFRVVGSSHYVSAPAYDFYELSSCKPVASEPAATVRLDGGRKGVPTGDDGAAPALEFDYEHGRLRCRTRVERRPLSAFPDGASFALSYRFEEDAFTTVDVGEEGYETYHTYPEYGLALYTRTVFESVPVPGVSDRDYARPGETVSRPSRTD